MSDRGHFPDPQTCTAPAPWCRKRDWTWWAVVAATLLLFARKPWAILTPQLWAEDGPIHLADTDSWGAHAFFVPYRGYLHLLPRLIAWLASHLADVAYWPALYNAAAFLVAITLLARLASRRVDLPAKPWLVLSFVLAAHTGEVWFNITNLHWLTAFFLFLQVLIDRPATRVQRFGDLAILVAIGLTGPFVIVFLPLLIWRWFRNRHADNLAVMLVAVLCAGVQIYFLRTSSPSLEAQARPLNLEMLLAVAGSRLVVWPFFGGAIAEQLPWLALRVTGVVFVVGLLIWALRADSRRLLRAQIAVAFVCMTAVCLWRIRPDTWAYPDLVNGDSYFYVPRILLMWLLILEFDARPRGVAIAARALGLLGLAMQAPRFTLPAAPDYHWAHYCDAIRRGDPAWIPTLPEGYVFDYPGRPRDVKPRATAVMPIADLPTRTSRLISFSVLTKLSSAEPEFTMGTVVGGVGTSGEKTLVVRAVGPSLRTRGVTDAVADPSLAVMLGQIQVVANDDWAADNPATLRAAFVEAGAFAFRSEDSRDAAVAFRPVIPSTTSYTVKVSGKGSSGTVLAELYDATPPGSFKRTTPRLINFSVLKRIPGEETMVVDIVIAGATPLKVLLRAIGPTLTRGFGVGGAMADPTIQLRDTNGVLVAWNNDWIGSEPLSTTFGKVGAFQLPPGSRDAAIIVTLKAGSYRAHLHGNDRTGGVTLFEVYEVP